MNPIHSNILFIIFAFNIYFGDALRICIPNIIGRCVISNHNKRSKEEYTNIKKHRHHLNSAKDNDIHNWEYKRYSSDFIVLEDRVLEYLGEYNHDSLSKNFNMNKKVEVTLSNEELLLQLQSIITKQQLYDIELLANNTTDKTNLYMYFDYEISKIQRTTIHKSIKSLYPNLESKTEIQSVTNQNNNNTCIFIHKKGVRSIEIEDKSDDISVKASTEVSLSDDNDNKNDIKPKKNKRKVLPARWQSDKPEYYHFTVIKNGYNNADMLSYIARKISLLPSRLGYCGSKDKHAISLQRVSAWRVDKEALERINSIKLKQNNNDDSNDDITKIDKKNILIRDITIETTPLTTGDLLGNHFIITLRPNIKPSMLSSAPASSTSSLTTITSSNFNHDNIINLDELQYQNHTYTSSSSSSVSVLYKNTLEAIQSLSNQSFPNYFGSQRFGSPVPTNPLVGELLIKGDYQRAVFVILLAPYNDMEVQLMNASIDSLRYLLDCSKKNKDNEGVVINDKLDMNVFLSRWDQYVLILNEKIESLIQSIDDNIDNQVITKTLETHSLISFNNNDIVLDNDNEVNIDKQQLDEEDGDNNNLLYNKENIDGDEDNIITLDDNDDIISKNNDHNNNKILKEKYYLTSLTTKIKLITSLLHGKLLTSYEIRLLLKLSGGQLQKILWKDFIIRLDNYHQTNSPTIMNNNNDNNNSNNNNNNIDINGRITSNNEISNENIMNNIANNHYNDINYVNKLDYAAIFGKLQKSLRLLFINSYQSLLWNDCVKNRLDFESYMNCNSINNISITNNVNNFAAIVGDLVLVDYNKEPLTIWSLTEKRYTTTNADRVNQWKKNVKEITLDQSQEYKLYYHIVTKEEAELQIFPLQAIILPLPGRSTYIPSYMKDRITLDSTELLINNNENSKSTAIFQLPGAYRHVFANAKNVRYQDHDYSSSNSWKEVDTSQSIINNNPNFNNLNNIKDNIVTTITTNSTTKTVNNTKYRNSFSNEVHRKWMNGVIPKFLQHIYAHKNLIPTLGLPLSVIDPIYVINNNNVSNSILDNNISINNSTSSNSDDKIIRIAFSLGTSSYATTYLNWLLYQA